jgi:hypothetical protein
MNSFRQVKGMNEFRYKMFFMYVIDLHNLKMMKKLATSHPSKHMNELSYKLSSASLEPLKLPQPSEPVMTASNLATTTPLYVPVKCTICGKQDFGKLNSKSGLSRHMILKHPETMSDPSVLKCSKCPKECKSQSGLSRHVKLMHAVE